ncbi:MULTISPECIES: NPCBM/NEW2 domain-containing protein [Actinoalloteichus]|uniref:Carbohydrate binding protein,alpha-galactosidase family protein n=1 Tax=Actinoalloteichus fjordicus TaxID=1612552 RepID=A0AAC9PPV6_9PSEU|nr:MULTISPECIES: NPCBM/NEW2 domain-containing protein [Actinoalloteichus]APU12383.1 putative carbohydrate binding protein,alpha-galactosidase family protein [Actinoalloteichus fjordicus]APU18335.1 putative carbohydrate binding protein,alpha-galactosidase family protein [Actinoalloteichus sp. GBA129-24]
MRQTRWTAAALAALVACGGLAASASAGERTPDHSSVGTFDVMSDIQGGLQAFRDVREAAHELAPDSKALVINGDIVDRGYDFEYQEVTDIIAETPGPQTTLSSIGNHEAYAPAWCSPTALCQPSWPNGFTEEELYESFFAFAGRDEVYAEQVVDGIPLLALGTERLMWWEDPNLDDHVYLSDEQLDWLRARLDHHTRDGRPAFVFTHYPLYDTVTSSDGTSGEFHLQDEELRQVLGDYPQAVLFSSHTHSSLRDDKWARRVTVPGGHPDGFTAVNTGAVLNRQVLQVSLGSDGARIRARDVAADEWVQDLVIPTVDPRLPAAGLRVDPVSEHVAPGASVEVTAEFANLSSRRLIHVRLEPVVPEGWAAERIAESGRRHLGRGETASATWRLSPVDGVEQSDVLDFAVDAEYGRGSKAGRISEQASIEIVEAPSGTSYVSDLPFLSSSNGIGPVERDLSNGAIGEGDGHPLTVNGVRYDKGLGTMAPSETVVHLGQNCTRFAASVGVDDRAPQSSQNRPDDGRGDGGDVVFQVWADDEKVWDSGVVHAGEGARDMDVHLNDAETLRLVVTDGGDENWWDYADWGLARVTCGG